MIDPEAMKTDEGAKEPETIVVDVRKGKEDGTQETVSHFAERTLLVKGFPPFWMEKHLKKFMEKIPLEYEEIRTFKKSPKFWITFETLERKESARVTLQGMIPKPNYKKRLNCHDADLDGNWMNQKGKKRLRDDSDQIKRPKKKMKLEDLKTPKEVLTPWLTIEYDQQCLKKWRTVRKSMQKVIKELKRETPFEYKWMQDETVTHPVGCLASPVVSAYRNKDSFSIGKSVKGNRIAGCRLGSTSDGCVEIGNVLDVMHLHPASRYLVGVMNKLLAGSEFPVYERENHSGVWRNLLVRTAHATKEALVVILVQLKDVPDEQRKLLSDQIKSTFSSEIENLLKKFDFSLVGILLQDYDGLNDVVPVDHPYELLHGRPYLIEYLSGLKFQVSFQSFFQVNVPQAERMFEIAGKWASVSDKTVLFDICCGAGTIGLTLAKYVKNVVGLEIIPEAVRDANKNKELNNVSNCEFICGKAEDTVRGALDRYEDCDVVAIVDPPRSGLHREVLRTIRMTSDISRLVYVSCNPTTCAQNVSRLCRGKTKRFQGTPFKPVKCIAVDMFPHTPHTEMVLLLERVQDGEVVRDNEKKIKVKKQSNWGKNRR